MNRFSVKTMDKDSQPYYLVSDKTGYRTATPFTSKYQARKFSSLLNAGQEVRELLQSTSN